MSLALGLIEVAARESDYAVTPDAFLAARAGLFAAVGEGTSAPRSRPPHSVTASLLH